MDRPKMAIGSNLEDVGDIMGHVGALQWHSASQG